jgi:hypothetical protein
LRFFCRYFGVERKVVSVLKAVGGLNNEREDIVELLLITGIKRLAQDFDNAYGCPANVEFLRGCFYIFIVPVALNGYAQIGQQ